MDWAKLFNDLEKQGNIPDASSQTIDSAHAVFQSMYLDLGQIQKQITASGFQPPLVTVYADVLNLPNNLSWLLQRSVLMIVARQVQVGASVTFSLDFRTSQTASLLLFANEMEGKITAVAASSGDPKQFTLSAAPVKGGWQVLSDNGTPVAVERTRAEGMAMQPPGMFQQALVTEFLFASLLYDQQPPLALDMLTWLKDWSAESRDLLGMFLRSSSLVSLLSSQINAQANGAAFVPYLTQEVYTTLASAFVAEARQYESDYQTLSTQKVLTDQGIQLAKALLDNQTYQSEYVAKLLDMSKSNYDNAAAAVEAARKNFDKAQLNAKLVQIDFEQVGIPEWERAKILEAIISLATAVIEFGVGIGSMLVGNEAGGGAAAAGAIDGAKAVEAAAKTGSAIAKMAKDLADVMKELKKITEGLAKVYTFSKQVVAAAQNIGKAESMVKKMQEMNIDTDGADLSSTATWEIYRLNSDAALEGPVQQGIGYAAALQLAVREVAVYGQALAAAQLAAIRASQDYATVLLQKELAEKQQQRLRQYVDSLKAGEAPIVAMMQEFYQRYIDAKSSLFGAIQGYRASYFYWALQHSLIQPKVIDTVNRIDTGLKDLTSIALDRANALKRFSPPPQEMTRKEIVIEDAAVLAALRKEGTATWSVGLGADTFDGFDRVRLTTVRVWLEGVKPGASHLINVMMTTAGNYLDRYNGTQYQFTSKPLQRSFQYKVTATKVGIPAWEFGDGTYGYVEVDGTVDHEVSYAYFEPTPFAEWKIDLRSHNTGIDFSKVTKITMELAGSLIPEVALKRASVRRVKAEEPWLTPVGAPVPEPVVPGQPGS